MNDWLLVAMVAILSVYHVVSIVAKVKAQKKE